jgi:microcystin degradation protein MlrC
LFVAGVQHESSSFSPIPTSLRSFERLQWSRSQPQVHDSFGYGDSCVLAESLGWEVVAGPFFDAQPSQPCTTAAWAAIRTAIIGALVGAGGVDAVLLCLHGAQMSTDHDDCEGDLLEACRAAVGPAVPIAAMLDLHANVTPAMIGAADLVVSCREYPHIDYAERAAEIVPALHELASRGCVASTVAVRVAAPGVYPTPEEPMRQFVERLRAVQEQPGVLFASANHGFEGSDNPHTGGSIVVSTVNDRSLAATLAYGLAEEFLDTVRSVPSWLGPGVASAIDQALAAADAPVVVADRSDNPGAGAAGDSTFLLAELIARGAPDAALGMLWDPMAVRACHDAGVGAEVTLRIGGKAGPMSGPPLDVAAVVTSIRDDACQALFGVGDPRSPLGTSAAIRVGGIDVVLNSRREQVFSHHCFTEHGIDPSARRVVVVKSMQHFMGGFAHLAAQVIRCDGPGSASLDLTTLPFRRVRRPLLGLDPIEAIGIEPLATRQPTVSTSS